MEAKDIHQPLDKSELIGLLKRGRDMVDHVKRGDATDDMRMEISRIQVRIGNAIPGMTTPNPTTGEISRKQSNVDNLYVDFVERVFVEGVVARTADEVADNILQVLSGSEK